MERSGRAAYSTPSALAAKLCAGGTGADLRKAVSPHGDVSLATICLMASVLPTSRIERGTMLQQAAADLCLEVANPLGNGGLA
jgi:hypothetical protein